MEIANEVVRGIEAGMQIAERLAPATLGGLLLAFLAAAFVDLPDAVDAYRTGKRLRGKPADFKRRRKYQATGQDSNHRAF